MYVRVLFSSINRCWSRISCRWLRRWENATIRPSWFLTSTTNWSDETSSTASRSAAQRRRGKRSATHTQTNTTCLCTYLYVESNGLIQSLYLLMSTLLCAVPGSGCRRGGWVWRGHERNQRTGQLCCHQITPTLRQAGVQATGSGLHSKRPQTRQKGTSRCKNKISKVLFTSKLLHLDLRSQFELSFQIIQLNIHLFVIFLFQNQFCLIVPNL